MASASKPARGGFEELCHAASIRTDVVVKLHRFADGWGLEVALSGSEPRAAGVVFPNLDEIDQQARHLTRWMNAGKRRNAKKPQIPDR